MAENYYILINNIQKGPFPVEKLKSHGVKRDTLVWRKGLQNWVKAGEEPALRHLFPWQPPKQAPAPTDSAEAAFAQRDETAEENEQAKAPSSKPKPSRRSTKAKRSSFSFDDLKDWIDEHRNIVFGAAAGVLGLLLIIGVWMWTAGDGGTRDPYGVPNRGQADKNIQIRKKPNKPAKKKKKQPVNQKGVAGKNNDDETIPPGRLTEDYYRLVRDLSFDRFFRTVAVPNRSKRTAANIIADYKQLAAQANDDRIRAFAKQAAAVWESVPARTRRPVTGAGVQIRAHSRQSAGEPERLHRQVTSPEFPSPQHRFEKQTRQLWAAIVEHMQNALDRSAPLTPALAELKISRERNNAALPRTTTRALLLRAVNSGHQTLHHVTLRVTLQTPWGLQVTNHYYRDVWKADDEWPLSLGHVWGQLGQQLTTAARLTVWSDEGVMPPKRITFSERTQTVVEQTLDDCRDRLENGYYEPPLILAGGIAQNEYLADDHRSKATTLTAAAERLKTAHQALLEAAAPEAVYLGLWRFGKYSGPLGLTFVRAEQQTTKTTNRPSLFARNPRIRSDVRRTPVQAHLYEPSQPAEYKALRGAVEFLPEEQTFVLVLEGSGANQPGIDGQPSRLPDSSRNYLLKTHSQTYRLFVHKGELWGRMPRGDRLVFIRADQPAAQDRLAELRKRPVDFSVPGTGGSMSPLPMRVPAPAETAPLNIEWSVGELARFEAVNDTKQRVRRGTRVRRFEQVVFPAKSDIVFANTGKQTIAWNIRTKKQEFFATTGGPITVSPDGRLVAVPGNSGTRFYDGRTGRVLRGRRYQVDESSSSAAFSGDGRLLMTAGGDGRVNVWEVNGKQLLDGQHSTPVTAVAIAPDHQTAYSASRDHRITIWDLSEEKQFAGSFESGDAEIDEMRVSADGRFLLTVSKVGASTTRPAYGTSLPGHLRPGTKRRNGFQIQIIDLKTQEKVYSAQIGRQPTAVDISRDWTRALVADEDGPIALWDLKRGVETHQFAGHTEAAQSVRFSADGRFALSGGDDGFVILWGLPAPTSTGAPPTLPPDAKQVLAGKPGPRKILSPPTPVSEEAQKRNAALKKVRLAVAAAKAGRPLRAAEFLREAERIFGDDPIVQREIKRVRDLLRSGG